MKHILTAEDLEIAKLLNEGVKSPAIAKKLGLSEKTIDRRKKWPEMAEHLLDRRALLKALADARTKEEKLAQKQAARQVEKAKAEIAQKIEDTKAEIVWNFAESARRKLRIADDKEARHSDQLVAIKALDEMYGVLNAVPPPDPNAPPAEDLRPDVYQPEWMRKPQ